MKDVYVLEQKDPFSEWNIWSSQIYVVGETYDGKTAFQAANEKAKNEMGVWLELRVRKVVMLFIDQIELGRKK